MKPRLEPFFELLKARLREFVREPAAIFWVYVFPLLMMAALGIAFRNRPMENLHVVIQAGDGAQRTLESLRADERFLVEIKSPEECRRQMRTGKADVVIVAAAPTDGYTFRLDPTRPGSMLARNAVDDVLQRAAGRTDPVAVQTEEVNEPGGRYIDFLVPGLLGMGVMGGGLWGVGFAIVDMRIRKLLKRFVATPMKRTHFLGAVMTSRLVFMIPEVLILLLFARVVFGVANHGSYFTVGLLIVLGSFTFAGVGLLAASRAQTLETISGLMNLIMLPMWIFSGIFFSTERFPDVVQPLIRLLPLTPLIDALRRVMIEGATLASVSGEIVIVAAWGVGTFLLALIIFRWN